MDGLIEYKEGSTFLNVDGDWQDKVEIGKGQSYGVELFAQKKTGKLTGWIGYTLSWNNRKFDNLNFGKQFPYKYDRRHDISVATVYTLSDRIELSGAWVFGSGSALNLPQASYLSYDANRRRFPSTSQQPQQSFNFFPQVNNFGDRNSFRMADYHRLDLSISFTKKKKWGQRKWTIAVYNMYNRKNPFFIDIERRQDETKKFVQYSLFPIIPSFSYSFKF